MTAIEHHEIKGITVKNVVVTLISTASIVASVMTTYFGLKDDIAELRSEQLTEARINNIRLKLLEEQISVLQKQEKAFKIQAITNSLPDKSKLNQKLNNDIFLGVVTKQRNQDEHKKFYK